MKNSVQKKNQHFQACRLRGFVTQCKPELQDHDRDFGAALGQYRDSNRVLYHGVLNFVPKPHFKYPVSLWLVARA